MATSSVFFVDVFGTDRDPMEWPLVKQAIRKKFPTVRQLSTAELEQWLANHERAKPLLLDAREPEEYAVSHLHSARLAPSLKQALRALEGFDKAHPVVVYCSVGYRSSALVKRLQSKGFTDVYNLEGSIFEWANEGRPVFKGAQRVNAVHPYDEQWGRLLLRDLWCWESNPHWRPPSSG